MAGTAQTDTRVCTQCSAQFERVIGTARKKCFRCSPARITSFPDDNVTPIDRDQSPREPDIGEPPAPSVNQPHTPGRHERVVQAELEKLGVEETIEGVGALGLAFALDDQWLPGAQRTSMFKQLKETMDTLRMLAEPEKPDEVDFWTARIQKRAEQAGNTG